MKFGRTIKTSLYSEWSEKYLRYSELKKFIKKRLENNNGRWSDADEDAFVAELSKELDKVYDFQKAKVRERNNQHLASRTSSNARCLAEDAFVLKGDNLTPLHFPLPNRYQS